MKMKKIFLLLLLLPSFPVFAADSTSYAPPGVAQNQHQNLHGYSITAAGQVQAGSMYSGGQVLAGSVYSPGEVQGGVVSGSYFQDRDNPSYYLDPAGWSRQASILAGEMRDLQDSSYYVNPASTSRLNSAQANSLTAGSITLGGVPRTSWPGAEGSLGAAGWTRLPNGLIIQWGLVTTNAVRYKPFPIPFPTACVSIQVTANRNSTSATSGQAYSVDRFGANMVADITHGPAWWMALGY
ncbi:MAG: hypothetical protein SCI25_03480 [Desulfuromonadales bacterium]|nr:hypothetical protein [Desulfuromonadales bacterium]MDW7757288.1 hypothetical protein [Desulfuromonadales bacterium]